MLSVILAGVELPAKELHYVDFCTMDLTKTEEIYDLKRFKFPMSRRSPTERSINQENASLMDNTTSIGDPFETRSRFEQVFLGSPRAQVLNDWC